MRPDPDLALVFRALSDPSRLAIYELVRDCGAAGASGSADDLRNSVSEIARRFDLSLSTVSHHLKELRTAGLIRCERRGKRIFCIASPEVLDQIDAFVKGRS
jgi:DNA-binding transcriptional ArsR family regulator